MKLILGILISLFFVNLSFAEQEEGIVILAPKNMSLALSEISKHYARDRKKTITSSYGSVNEHLSSIEDGFPADIIISDHPEWINVMKQKGLVNIPSISNLVEDKLVLIIGKSFYSNSDFNIEKATEYQKYKFFSKLQLFINNVKDDLVVNYIYDILSNYYPLKNHYALTSEVVNSLVSMQTIKDSMAIVRYTDVYDDEDIVILESFNNSLYPRFVYQLAVIAGANNEEANDFKEYLTKKVSVDIFNKYGFVTLKK